MSASVQSEPFFGWRVVGAAFVLAMFGWGLGFYGPSIFLHTVQEERGWPVLLISAAVTEHFLVGAIVVANLPRLYRRYGVGTITKVGPVVLAFGLVGWALAREPWQLFIAAGLSGAGWVTMGAAAINAIVAPWFVTQRPKALSIAYNGGSFGGLIFSPLWVWTISTFGFAAATAAIGLVTIVAAWYLASHIFVHSPESLGQKPDGGVLPPINTQRPAVIASVAGASLWRNPRFLTLAIGMAFGLFAQIGLLSHLFSLIVPALGPQRAGWAMALATASAIAGRTGMGWLMPPDADRRIVAALSYGVQIIGSVMFLIAGLDNVPVIIAGVALFGFGIGNATSLPPLIAQVEFAKEDAARVVALVVACGQAAYAFAPAAFGLFRELPSLFPAITMPGSTIMFGAAATIQVLTVGVFLAGRKRA